MPSLKIFLACLPALAAPLIGSAEPLAIDLSVPVPAPKPAPFGPGATKNPQGTEFTMDQQSVFLNGKPFIPVVGEFHFSRYPQSEWRDELLKMKAGGINTVSSYVFWIHHEEEQGKFDWSGQNSLRAFLENVKEVGLFAVVRMGPWCHGEARNGGHPDWVQRSKIGLRTKDPRYLALVGPLYQEQAKQMQGLLWKDGGPVIGVQLDNENDRADFLLELKKMAKAAGVDVPFYTITGWQGGLPKSELIPLFGGYMDGFWGGSRNDYRKEFMFGPVRAMNDLGAQLETRNPTNSELIAQFPYACAEVGGGMPSSHARRIKIDSDTLAALSLTKLGNGNNLPGYYMYHGGIHPMGKLSSLQEYRPNRMPVKDYDWEAPLSMSGRPREHYYLFRQQHLFLEQFGASFARMTAFFPEIRSSGVGDFETVRWAMRSDGTSGFLFFSNEQNYDPLPEHKDVQFAVKTAAGATQLVPRQPFDIPTGSYGMWPINLDCDGVRLDYATVQPLTRITQDDGGAVYFFAALEGIRPEFCIGGKVIPVAKPGTGLATEAKNAAGKMVRFVVLTPEEAKQLGRVTFAGRERLILTEALVLEDPPSKTKGFRLQTDAAAKATFAFFPGVSSVSIGGKVLRSIADGGFGRFTPATVTPPALEVTMTLEKPAGPGAGSYGGTNEKAWDDARTYKVDLPAVADDRRVELNFHYIGDAARVYAGAELVMDNFYNGDPLAVALWRIPAAERAKLTFKVLPPFEKLYERLPDATKKTFDRAKADGALDHVSVTATDLLEFSVTPG